VAEEYQGGWDSRGPVFTGGSENKVSQYASSLRPERPDARRGHRYETSRRPTAGNPSIRHIGDTTGSAVSLPPAVVRIRRKSSDQV
jgi:hypothetical protein